MMDHWTSVLSRRVIEIPHIVLVSNPEPEIRRLLAACKLPFDARCLRPDLAEDRVKSGSVEQMSDHINDKGIGRWRHYEKHLGPLIEALGPYIDPDYRTPSPG
jgi:hypothetical protein